MLRHLNSDTSTNNNASNTCRRSKDSKCEAIPNTLNIHKIRCSLRSYNEIPPIRILPLPYSRCNTCSTCKALHNSVLLSRRQYSLNVQLLQRVDQQAKYRLLKQEKYDSFRTLSPDGRS